MPVAPPHPSTPPPSVTVSIVSHGQWHLVLPLLSQLQEFCSAEIAMVVLTLNIPERIIFDTNSFDFPFKCIRNPKPQGFGRNHNQAFQHCVTPWFLILNPDIRLNGCPLQVLLPRALEGTGLLAPRVVEPGMATPQPHRRFITPPELLSHRLAWRAPPTQPDWVPGMFMLVRQQAYAQLGGFDERFYMYCEDHDFCLRLQLTGWKMQAEDDAVVIHEAQRLSHSSLRALKWHLASLVKTWASAAFWRFAFRTRA
ncbi:glycosyl transferase [Diaphorobacter nitroreducens]|nr:glycosyl transferase [Diaphorobacter nitroreducens]